MPFLAQLDLTANSAIITFGIYILAVFGIAMAAHRLQKSKSFMSEYFLGSRSLGVWGFALTFAATSSSGGSFIGVPSTIYTYGWSAAQWIGSYMIVPLLAMALLGKRLNQVARKTGAITIPDVFRDRYESPGLGNVATGVIVIAMIFNLIAQFKAGSLILASLMRDVPLFQSASEGVAVVTEQSHFLSDVEPGYLISLLVFAFVVVIYTTYGGFRAVVWTDVLQGFVMAGGVIIMLPLAIWAAGGLSGVTEDMQNMKPPMTAEVSIRSREPITKPMVLQQGQWLPVNDPFSLEQGHYYRLAETTTLKPNDKLVIAPAIEFTFTERQSERIPSTADDRLEVNVYAVDPHGAPTNGGYVQGPGWMENEGNGHLPLALAVSFFFMWTFSNAGQPSNMVRLMAFKNTRTLKHAIFTVSIYYTIIYFPLVLIFCCARVVLPGWEVEADRIMPEMALEVTRSAGFPWLAGLLVAAPFAAVMSTMDSFLLMISSAIVRDIYQKNINPNASEKKIKRLTYLVTIVVGALAMTAAIYPPEFLQKLIILTGATLSCSFLAPMALSLYWPRCTKRGAMNGILMGFMANIMLYALGYWINGRLEPFKVAGFHPFIVGSLFSLFSTVFISLVSPPPPAHLVQKYFYK